VKSQNRAVNIDKGTFHQEDMTIVNIYTLNVSVPDFIEQTLLDIKTQINCNSVIVDDFNNPLSPVDMLSRQIIDE
jgi:hypothetical protein